MPAAESTPSPDREIVISREFSAPRELVWNAMTDPNQVVKWWGPNGFSTSIETMDVRPGGVWKHTMHGPDGTNYPNKSIFREVVAPERIVYSHGGGREEGPGANFIATWTFEDLGANRTRLTIRMVFPSAEMRDFVAKEFGAVEGGKQTLARLAQELPALPLVIERTFEAPVAKIWAAITQLDQLKQWFFPQLAEFTATPGFTTEFTLTNAGKDFVHQLKVSEVVPPRMLSFHWRYAGYPGDSIVTLELIPDGNRTRLRLTHRGLESFQPGTFPQFGVENFYAGWTSLVGTQLKNYLELPSVA